MESKRTGLFREIINFIESIKNGGTDKTVNFEEKLTPEEKAELDRIRKEDKVENIRAKYSASVDSGVAKIKAQGRKVLNRTEKIKE